MSKIFQYFSIPFERVSTDQAPPYPVWFATWSTKPPILEPGMAPPLVVGVTDGALPAGAVALGVGGKDPPPPPPPMVAGDLADYQETIRRWLMTGRDADE
jgi:hypothetical protein